MLSWLLDASKGVKERRTVREFEHRDARREYWSYPHDNYGMQSNYTKSNDD